MSDIDAHRGPQVPPIQIFEKIPHKNAIKHEPPLIFSQPQVPPLKRICQENQGPPPPWIYNYCASMLSDKKTVKGLWLKKNKALLPAESSATNSSD